jgi:hypothetical protein
MIDERSPFWIVRCVPHEEGRSGHGEAGTELLIEHETTRSMKTRTPIIGGLFGTFLLLSLGSRHAASRCAQAASALIPMAQMKPSSSRATAVMVFLCSLPRAISFI